MTSARTADPSLPGFRRVTMLTIGEPLERLRCRQCRWVSEPFPPGGLVPEAVVRSAEAHDRRHGHR